MPSSSGVNAVGSVVLSLSDIYFGFDVNACSVKVLDVFHLLQDMVYVISDFAEFARRESRAAIGRWRFRVFPFFIVPCVAFFKKHVRIGRGGLKLLDSKRS